MSVEEREEREEREEKDKVHGERVKGQREEALKKIGAGDDGVEDAEGRGARKRKRKEGR